MPINAREVADFNAYKKAVGADNDAPVGTFLVEVERASVRTNENTGIPSLNLMFRIQDGEQENKTFFNQLGWFVSETDREGDPKTPAKMESGTRFVRQLTTGFLAAIYGYDFTDYPEGFLIADPEVEETPETMMEAFDQWAELLVGETVQVRVTDGKDREGNLTGFQNFKYSPAEVAFAGAV